MATNRRRMSTLTMKDGARSPWLWAMAGTVAMIAYLLAVEVTPFLSSSPDSVPSPVQTGNVRSGDYVYYLSLARELAEGDWPPEAPTNSQMPSYERARIVPVAIAAMPYLLTDDTRIVLLLEYVLIAVGLTLPAYGICLLITGRVRMSAALAVLALTYSVVWSALPFGIDPLAGGIRNVAEASARATALLADPPDKFVLGDQFRTVQPSLSIVCSLVFLWLVLGLRSIERPALLWGRAAATVVVGVLLCLTYPPVTLVSYLALMSVAAAALVLGEWRNFMTYLVVGGSILVLLGILGVPQFVVAEMNSSPLISRLYPASHLFDSGPLAAITWAKLSSKYVVFSLLLVPLALVSRKHRFVILTLLVLSVMLTVANLFIADPTLARRMGVRAADLPWFLLYVSAAAAAALDVAGRIKRSRTLAYAASAGCLLVLALPFAGQVRSAVAEYNRQAYRLTADDHGMLSDLAGNYPDDAVVATLDWRLIQLIGMFTNLDPAVSDIGLSARTPEVEMQRLIELYKAFGIPKEVYLDDVRNGVRNVARLVRPYQDAMRTASAAPYRKTPFIDWQDFRSSSIVGNVLRVQNLPEYAGIKSLSDGDLSPQLMERLSSEWDSAPECASWILSEVHLVLWDADTLPPLHWKCPVELEPVRQRGALSLYAPSGPGSASGH